MPTGREEPMASPPNPKPAPSTNVRINSLGLTPRELGELLVRLDAEGSGGGNPRRQFIRASFRIPNLPVRIAQPGGSSVEVPLVCRNLSREGMSLLHSSYVHAGSPISAKLPTLKGTTKPVTGTVVRCTHRGGKVHEIGVKFEEPIDLREFIPARAGDDPLSFERVEGEKLVGTIAVVNAGPLDRQILQSLLRGTQLRVRAATGANEALAMVHEGLDLVFYEASLPLEASLQGIAAIRAGAPKLPIIAIASDAPALGILREKKARADVLISKPLSQGKVQRAIAEFLLLKRPVTVEAYRGATEEATVVEMSPEIAAEIAGWVAAFEKDLAAKDPKVLAARCVLVQHAAPHVGLQRVAGLAAQIAERLAMASAIEDVTARVRELIQLCREATAPSRG